MIITFRVDGVPKAQPRVKAWARKLGDKVVARVFTPGTAEEWKALVAVAAKPHLPASPIQGPIRLAVAFLLPRPKTLCRKRDPQGQVWHTAKPDADNAVKAVKDCLTQQGWWRDDAQICHEVITKHYHAIGERPGAVIEIEALHG